MQHRRWKIIACLFLIVATLATYSDLGTHQFINFDDNAYVTSNLHVQAGLTFHGLSWAFTTLDCANWHPLTWLSHMLDCQLFGLNPKGPHLTNLVFHIANSLLLFLWLLYLTRALGCSFLVAALFALHPLNVESVAWVAERKNVLSTFFWLLTMWAYVWYVERPRLGRYMLILVCFILGLMSKPMLVTLPVVLLLLDYWPLGRLSLQGLVVAEASSKPGPAVTIRRLVIEKLPLFVISAIACVVTFYAAKEGGALRSFHDIPVTYRLANALLAYVSYLYMMFWPVHLSIHYPLRQYLPIWQMLAALVLAVLTLLALGQTRRRPYLLVGWLWYLCTLLPVIGLVQVGGQAMADRYTYVPFIGLFIVVAWGTADLMARWSATKFLFPVGAGVILSALMICTWIQVSYWRNANLLYEHSLQVTGDSSMIHNNLGNVLEKQGKLDQAMDQYAEAVRFWPDFFEAHFNLGNVLAEQGKPDEAMAQYAEVLRLKPDFVEAHYNWGKVLERQGKLDQAMAQYAEAVRLKPDYAKAHNNLGSVLAMQGKPDEAIAQYTEALRLKPDFVEAHYNLGNVLASQGKLDEAMAQYAEAVRLKPDYAKAHNNLGSVLAMQGKLDEAMAQFAEAARLKPDYLDALNNLGNVCAEHGKIDETINIFQNALKIDPKDTNLQKTLNMLKTKKAQN